MKNIINLIVEEKENGQRVDLFVKNKSILISFSDLPTINLMIFFIIYNINTICVRSSTG